MSKIGNMVVAIQESEHYRFGYESADRGEPEPRASTSAEWFTERHQQQLMGWRAYHQEQVEL